MEYFVSWSGGKDSCLALHHACKQYGKPRFLLTMMIADLTRTRSHGLARGVIEAQAKMLGVETLFVGADWSTYEINFQKALGTLKKHGISAGVFGDIHDRHDGAFSRHRDWADRMCADAGMESIEPLWDFHEATLVEMFLSSHIECTIVAAKDGTAAQEYMGAILTQSICNDLKRRGVHPLGERGEFHTVVTNSPLFGSPLVVKHRQQILKDGYWFLDLELA